MVDNLIFLKLGGSLVTDKQKPFTVRENVLPVIADQIAEAQRSDPKLTILLGHGSGSFGHTAAARYGTRDGVSGPEGWRGFSEVWFQASRLNHLVMEALHQSGIDTISMPPSAMVIAKHGKIITWELENLRQALSNRLMPVIFGDVIFDCSLGGTILSTEDLFMYLARQLKPRRILLAGIEAGVWADYPSRSTLIKEITPRNISSVIDTIASSSAVDVTGGMRSKVLQMLMLTGEIPSLQIHIFSGLIEKNILDVLQGASIGTLIRGVSKT